MQRPRVLVTGAGGPGAVNLSRSLMLLEPRPWILAADASPHYVLLALGDARALLPRASDREAYLDAVAALCRQHAVDVVMPNNSIEIAVLSEARDRVPARMILPDPPVLRVSESKWASYEAWRDAGIPVPETRLLEAPDDVARAFAELQVGEEGPVWVRGAGIPGKGIGVASLPARTVEQAVQWVAFWRGWGGMIASEYLPGDNLTWMGLFDRGRLVASQGRRRIAYVIPHVSPSGITGAPAISHTIRDAAVNDLGEAAVLALDPAFHGVGFVDMKGDAQGRPRVTELNAGRFGTTHFFYSAAGANFPGMALRLALGQPVEGPTRDLLPEGLTWIRTLDAGPVLTTRDAVEGRLWPAEADLPWPRVPQRMGDFPPAGPVTWPSPEDPG